MIMGSRSFFKPVTRENRLQERDVVPYGYNKLFRPKISEIKVDSFLDDIILDVSKAPEFELLTDKQLEQIFSNPFKVAHENNRMAYQIKETIAPHEISMITSATLPGTVQLTPLGKLIVLMKDGQTTGGYPRIMQLTDKAICILAQKREGDTISFNLI
jgi:allophanate hydrolase subunit 2